MTGSVEFRQLVAQDVIQTFTITLGGAIITFALQYLRDRAARLEAVKQAIRDNIKTVDELYRATKQIKRQMRARATVRRGIDEAPADAKPLFKSGEMQTYLLPKIYLDDKMDELSKLQLSLEQLKQVFGTRSDLFAHDRRRRIIKYLEYADDYYHRVFQDFEERRPILSEGNYEITPGCKNLRDFLDRGKVAKSDAKSLVAKLDGARTSAERDTLIGEILAQTEDAATRKKRRTRVLTDACLRAALTEMREELNCRSAAPQNVYHMIITRWTKLRPAPAGPEQTPVRPQGEEESK